MMIMSVSIGSTLRVCKHVIAVWSTLLLRPLVLVELELILKSTFTLFNLVVESNVLTNVRVVILLLELFLTLLLL